MKSEAVDIRAAVAHFYDQNKNFPADLDFYRARIPGPSSSILELGCGTGRMLLPLSAGCGSITGVDNSAAMLEVCRQRLEQSKPGYLNAEVIPGDVTQLHLGRKFDLIIAPYRVFQNLETSEQIAAFFSVIQTHLAPSASCILNVFHLDEDFVSICDYWQSQKEVVRWTAPYGDGTLNAKERVERWDVANKVLYPELIYCYLGADGEEQELTASISMRCYYPDEFVDLITSHGFRIINRWGGYNEEPYGQGSELVVEFTAL